MIVKCHGIRHVSEVRRESQKETEFYNKRPTHESNQSKETKTRVETRRNSIIRSLYTSPKRTEFYNKRPIHQCQKETEFFDKRPIHESYVTLYLMIVKCHVIRHVSEVRHESQKETEFYNKRHTHKSYITLYLMVCRIPRHPACV